MTIKVLVVDDSGFFRRRLSELINADSRLEVIGTAVNGQEAVDQAARLKPDVITMDYEMPVMDGITAVRHIVQASRTPVLMFSSLTYEGARVTLDALEAGAVDYLPKNFEDISHHADELQKILCERIVVVSRSRSRSAPAAIASAPAAAPAQAETRSYEPAASGRQSASRATGDYWSFNRWPDGTAGGADKAARLVSVANTAGTTYARHLYTCVRRASEPHCPDKHCRGQ